MSENNIPSITGAIFDCDGTLLDSLEAWRGIEGVLAREAKVHVSAEERALFTTFTIPEVAGYFHETYGLGKTAESVQALINEYMLDYYQNRASLLPGVVQFLEACAREDVIMSVASSSALEFLEAGLAGTGIREYFSSVISVDQVGSSKREPYIFNYACEQMKTDRKTTWGFEDSVYAMKTLSDAHFPVVGIYESSENNTEELRTYAQIFIQSFDELTVVNRRLAYC